MTIREIFLLLLTCGMTVVGYWLGRSDGYGAGYRNGATEDRRFRADDIKASGDDS